MLTPTPKPTPAQTRSCNPAFAFTDTCTKSSNLKFNNLFVATYAHLYASM